MTFFRGQVSFISTGISNSKYSIIENGGIIEVKNKLHIRFLSKQFSIFPEQFEIMAPINAVKTINGKVPRSYLHECPEEEYIALRNRYYNITQSDEISLLSPPKTVKWKAKNLSKSRIQFERIVGNKLKDEEWSTITKFLSQIFEENPQLDELRMKRAIVLGIYSRLVLKIENEDEETRFIEKRLAKLYGMYVPDIE